MNLTSLSAIQNTLETVPEMPHKQEEVQIRVLQQDSGFFKPDVFLVQRHQQLMVRKDYNKYARTLLAPLARRILAREARVLQRLADWPRSPNLIEQPTPYRLYMSYIEGDKLKTAIKQGHPFSMGELLRMLGELHHRNICHNDLRGANILVTREGKLYLIDYATAVSLPDWLAPVRRRMRCMDLGSLLKLKRKFSDQPYSPRELRLMSGRGWYRALRYLWKQQVLRRLGLR